PSIPEHSCSSQRLWNTGSSAFADDDGVDGATFRGYALPRRVFVPALRAQHTRRAFAAAITPIMARAAFAEIAGVGMFADQIDQPCPAEFVRQLPGRGLVQPHQRRVQLEGPRHSEAECRLQR